MEREPSQRFDILILDAFSGDSIPTHLLTKEAFDVYHRHLTSSGIIAIHISNQHIDLQPVVQRLAQHSGVGWVRIENKTSPPQTRASQWVLVTDNDDFLGQAEIRERSSAVAANPNFPLWTDQHSNIVQLLKVY